MARDCAVCGDLCCDCKEHYDPTTFGNGLVVWFGICRSCTLDLTKLIDEKVTEGGEGTLHGTNKRAPNVAYWLQTNPLPQRKPTRNTTQPMRAGVSS